MPSFTAETRVVRLGPWHLPPTSIAKHRRAVLWPIWEFRIAVVRGAGDMGDLNILQRAVMRMIRAGVVDVDRIAQALHLDPELVGHITRELNATKLLGTDGRPASESKSEALGPEDVYHLVQDAFTGTTLPRVLRRVPTVEQRLASVEGRADRPEIRPGRRARWDRPGWFRPNVPVHPALPEAPAVIEAARLHRSAFQRAELHLPALDRPNPPPRLERLAGVLDEARPRLALLSVFFDQEADDGRGDWAVWDPTIASPSATLRTLIGAQVPDLPYLAELIDGITRDAVGVRGPEFAEVMAQARNEGTRAMEMRIPAATAIVDGLLRDRLADVFTCLAEGRLEPNRQAAHHSRAAVAAGRFAERALRASLDAHPNLDDAVIGQLAAGRKHTTALLNDLASSVGLKVPLPEKFTAQSELDKKLRGSFLSQRVLTVGLLLTAINDESTPWRRVGATAPGVIDSLELIAEARNSSAHDGELQGLNEPADQITSAVAEVVTLHNAFVDEGET